MTWLWLGILNELQSHFVSLVKILQEFKKEFWWNYWGILVAIHLFNYWLVYVNWKCWFKSICILVYFMGKKIDFFSFYGYPLTALLAYLLLQAFLDFRNFRFTAVYNSILFSSALVLLSNLDLRSFYFCEFFFVSTR